LFIIPFSKKFNLLKVGNKCDRGGRRKVGVQEAKEWAERFFFFIRKITLKIVDHFPFMTIFVLYE